MLQILLIDDHDIIRQGLKYILTSQFPSAKIEEVADAEDVMEKILNTKFDVVICDLSMPGRNGLDVVKQIRQTDSKLPVLIFSMHSEEQYAIRALKAGASGYLNKSCGTTELMKAIQKVLQGRKYISPDLAEKLAEQLEPTSHDQPHCSLSDRELYVLKLIAEGKSLSSIAEQLSLGITTISTHRARILNKMNMRNNAELVKYALQNGITDLH
jgi:two-component system, NarL family, invasion response regulator UvrY